MTAEKHFKHLVRQRMHATGESYTVARTALRQGQIDVALTDPLVVDAHGRHGQTVVFTADGHGVVSGGQDALIRITDARTGDQRAKFAGHTKVVNGLALAADGLLVSVSSDRTARVWDLASAESRHVLTGHRDAVVTVSAAPDGTTAVTAGYDGRLLHWDLGSGTCLSQWRSDLRRVSSVVYTPDGEHTVEAGQGGAVFVRTVSSGDVVAHVDTGAPGVIGLAVAPDGSMVAAAGYDGTVSLWASGTWEEVRRMPVGDRATAVAFSRSGRLLGVAARRRVVLFSASEDDATASTDLPIDGVYALAFSPDGRRLAQTGADGRLRVWTLR